jgi:hypothetical protein
MIMYHETDHGFVPALISSLGQIVESDAVF